MLHRYQPAATSRTAFACQNVSPRRLFLPAALTALAFLLLPSVAAARPRVETRDTNCRILYLGFVGALEPPHNKVSGVVQISRTLQTDAYPDVCAKSFSPYVWTSGLAWLLSHFPAHSGPLTPDELLHAPKVILVGHSMGGWALMSVARDLRARDIPIELTVQVDSVGVTDVTLPRNVKAAAIFHANDILMPLTTKRLKCEDPQSTRLLANVTVKNAGHESITRDPRIRALVMDTIASLRATFANAAPAVLEPQSASTSP